MVVIYQLHLLGLPIKGYTANAMKSAVEVYPLNDPEVGRDRASSLGCDRSSWPRAEEPDIECEPDMERELVLRYISQSVQDRGSNQAAISFSDFVYYPGEQSGKKREKR